MSSLPTTAGNGSLAIRLNRAVYWLSRHWLLTLSIIIGIYVGLPWLAPVLMEIGWTTPGKAIYLIYSTQCHQLPQRSFFLFGSQPMYSLAEVQAAWQNTYDPAVLRQFIGGDDMGWKVAWSDRMVYMYTSILFWSVIFRLKKRQPKPLPWWALVLLILPLGVDGFTHLVSDFTAGIGLGFRYDNAWLAELTRHSLPSGFYSGDAPGSFNSLMRLISGLLFGLGLVWEIMPRLQSTFAETAMRIEEKFKKAELQT